MSAGLKPGARLAVLALTSNAFIWGVSWWPFRQLQAQGLHPLWATSLMYIAAVAALLAVRPGAWRGFAAHPLLWVLMCASGVTNLGFNWAVTVGDVVRVVLLFYIMPAWTVLLAWPLLGERPSLGSLGRLALALTGLAVVLKPAGAEWPLPQSLPDWLGLTAGLCFALNNILLRKLSRVQAESRVMAMFTGGALTAGAAASWGVLQGSVPAPALADATGWGIAVALTGAFLLGNMALQYGASRLNAHTTALVMLSEVLFASLSSVALGAAEITSRTLMGGALIIAAAVWSAWPAGNGAGRGNAPRPQS